MSEYIRTNKFDTNECPNIFVKEKLIRTNVRIYIRDQYIRIFKYIRHTLLWIISCRQFKETLKNVWTILRWRKRVQLMWLWIITGTQFLKTFEETKQVCADRLTDIHILGQSDTKLVWGSDSNYWEIMNESIFAGLWQSLSGKVRAEWKSTMKNGLKGNG